MENSNIFLITQMLWPESFKNKATLKDEKLISVVVKGKSATMLSVGTILKSLLQEVKLHTFAMYKIRITLKGRYMLIKDLRSPSDEDSSKRKTPLGLFSAQSLQIEERCRSSASITLL